MATISSGSGGVKITLTTLLGILSFITFFIAKKQREKGNEKSAKIFAILNIFCIIGTIIMGILMIQEGQDMM